MVLGFAAALLVAQAPATAAEDWWLLRIDGRIGDQQAFYVDRASIRRNGERVQITMAREAENPSETSVVGARIFGEYDCRARTTRNVGYVFVLADGRRITEADRSNQFRPVPPDSASERALRFACGEEEGEQVGGADLRELTLRRFAQRARARR